MELFFSKFRFIEHFTKINWAAHLHGICMRNAVSPLCNLQTLFLPYFCVKNNFYVFCFPWVSRNLFQFCSDDSTSFDLSFHFISHSWKVYLYIWVIQFCSAFGIMSFSLLRFLSKQNDEMTSKMFCWCPLQKVEFSGCWNSLFSKITWFDSFISLSVFYLRVTFQKTNHWFLRPIHDRPILPKIRQSSIWVGLNRKVMDLDPCVGIQKGQKWC